MPALLESRVTEACVCGACGGGTSALACWHSGQRHEPIWRPGPPTAGPSNGRTAGTSRGKAGSAPAHRLGRTPRCGHYRASYGPLRLPPSVPHNSGEICSGLVLPALYYARHVRAVRVRVDLARFAAVAYNPAGNGEPRRVEIRILLQNVRHRPTNRLAGGPRGCDNRWKGWPRQKRYRSSEIRRLARRTPAGLLQSLSGPWTMRRVQV